MGSGLPSALPALLPNTGCDSLMAILDSQTRDSFISDRFIKILYLYRKDYGKSVKGATKSSEYIVKGRGDLKAKCIDMDIRIHVIVI